MTKKVSENKNTRKKNNNEFDLNSLPPIEDLYISVESEQCFHIGHILSTVDQLVVVEALRGTPALDLDSVLFLDHGSRALGMIFETFGPVIQPFYSIRFNSNRHIEESKIEIGMSVYYAPKTRHTSFIFIDQLRNMKGTDASHEYDYELEENVEEFSDDEKEREYYRLKANKPANNKGSRPTNKVLSGEKKMKFSGNNADESTPHIPFYRRSRNYNPKEFGPITWNSVSATHRTPNAGPSSNQNNFHRKKFKSYNTNSNSNNSYTYFNPFSSVPSTQYYASQAYPYPSQTYSCPPQTYSCPPQNHGQQFNFPYGVSSFVFPDLSKPPPPPPPPSHN